MGAKNTMGRAGKWVLMMALIFVALMIGYYFGVSDKRQPQEAYETTVVMAPASSSGRVPRIAQPGVGKSSPRLPMANDEAITNDTSAPSAQTADGSGIGTAPSEGVVYRAPAMASTGGLNLEYGEASHVAVVDLARVIAADPRHSLIEANYAKAVQSIPEDAGPAERFRLMKAAEASRDAGRKVIANDIEKIIGLYAAANHFSIVLNKSGAEMDSSPVVLYSSSGGDFKDLLNTPGIRNITKMILREAAMARANLAYQNAGHQ